MSELIDALNKHREHISKHISIEEKRKINFKKIADEFIDLQVLNFSDKLKQAIEKSNTLNTFDVYYINGISKILRAYSLEEYRSVLTNKLKSSSVLERPFVITKVETDTGCYGNSTLEHKYIHITVGTL